MVANAVVLVAATSFLRHHPATPWRVPIALAPIVPIGFAVWGALRAQREMDELERRIVLEGKAFATTTVVMTTIGYGFLQMAGFPPLSPFAVPVALIALSWVGCRLAGLKYG